MGKNKNKPHLRPSLVPQVSPFPTTQVKTEENPYRVFDFKGGFTWSIKGEHYIPTKGCSKKVVIDFMEETVRKLNHYEQMTWAQVLGFPHNHLVSQEQIKTMAYREKLETLLKKLNIDVELYQLAGGQNAKKHRLFGYVLHNKFFLLINDCNHEQS